MRVRALEETFFFCEIENKNNTFFLANILHLRADCVNKGWDEHDRIFKYIQKNYSSEVLYVLNIC